MRLCVLAIASLTACGRFHISPTPDGSASEDDGAIQLVDSDGSSLPPPTPVSGARTCLGLFAAGTVTNGTYTIDPDDIGPLPPMQASCDMDRGGWTLVLDYVHRAQTTPSLVVRTIDLPLLGSDVLGTDEAGTATWGHAGTQLLAQVPFSQIWFYCRSSAHTRVVSYATGSTSCVSYLMTGGAVGCQYITSPGEALADHSGMLPLQATHVLSFAGDEAMTNEIFYKNTMPKANWEMGLNWACDEQANGAGTDTIHRVWVR